MAAWLNFARMLTGNVTESNLMGFSKPNLLEKFRCSIRDTGPPSSLLAVVVAELRLQSEITADAFR